MCNRIRPPHGQGTLAFAGRPRRLLHARGVRHAGGAGDGIVDSETHPRPRPSQRQTALEGALRGDIRRLDRESDLPRWDRLRHGLLGRLEGDQTWREAARPRTDLGGKKKPPRAHGPAALPRWPRLLDRQESWPDVLRAENWQEALGR